MTAIDERASTGASRHQQTPLLEARDVGVSFSAHRPPAVADANLVVAPGAALGIVGESGSGKTTLGRVLVGALEPTAGEVLVEGRPWSEIHRRNPQRRHVQMVFQDPYGSLNPAMTARETVAEVVRVLDGVGKAQARNRAGELLAEVGLSREAMDRRPRTLSGGQCQRVGIARALACDPRVLVADEPTSALDVSVQAQILNLLARLRDERELALVLVSHDLGVIRYATDDALVMYAGHIVERGPTDQLLTSPMHPYTRLLVDSIPGNKGDMRVVLRDVQEAGGCVYAHRCPLMHEDCLAAQPTPRDHVGRSVACLHPLPTPTMTQSLEERCR